MTNSIKTIVLCISIAIIAGYIGYVLGASHTQPLMQQGSNLPIVSQNTDTGTHLSAQRIAPPGLVTQQQAIAVGTITKIDQKSVTVQGINNVEGTFPFSPTLVIFPLESSTSAKLAKAVIDRSTMKVGQKVILKLDLVGDTYQVTSVTIESK